MEPEGVVGEDMPVPKGIVPKGIVKVLVEGLGSLKEVEGHIVTETFSAAVFEGTIESGKISVPQHIQKVLSEGDIIKIIAVKIHKKTKEG